MTEELSERERINQQYAEANKGVEKPVEQALLEAQSPELPKADETPTEPAPVEPEKELGTPAEEKKEPEPSEKKEQEKENNLKKALDEERSKRKRLREANEALEAKLKGYEARQEPPKEPDPITDYDAELNSVKAKLRSIELMEARRVEDEQRRQLREQTEREEAMVKKIDAELAGQGYAGFEFMAGAVTKELYAINAVDPEEAQSLNNPEGWKKIFKEKIYPNFRKQSEEAARKRTLEEKKALKKDANLQTAPGKAPIKSEDDNPETWSPERRNQEYLKLRRKNASSL